MAKLRDNLLSAAIGGAAGLVGALVIVALHIRGGGLDAGDILGFFGGIVGTALAVGGALWIEERKRRAAIAEGAGPVLDALLALERKSRDFFGYPGERRKYAVLIDEPMAVLNRLLPLAPPRTARLIVLFDRLNEGAAFLTSEVYLELDEEGPMASVPERHKIEDGLELFDGPLKLLIVEYSRLINPKSVRAVAHLGEMPEV